jgi:rfaE bifunctional protein nucleotidyltransferase chain/domain
VTNKNPFGKRYELSALIAEREKWRSQNEVVVFTNGVFDLIHPGHVLYLQEAAALGTKLIVGLNADDSVKLLQKGQNRPIQNEDARAIVLAAMSMIDALVLFSDENPYELILALQPDILVKGGDYTLEQIIGADEVLAGGGKVKTLQFVPGYSTTLIEQKIRHSG